MEDGRSEDFAYLSRFDWKAGEFNKKHAIITTPSDRDFLLKLHVNLRDMNKQGMHRGEVIETIMAIALSYKRKAENHFDYLRSSKQLPELKDHGHMQCAQCTTTKRSHVTTKKIFCWHKTCDAVLIESDQLNGTHPACAVIVLKKLIDYFWGNFDESNMSASAGTVDVVGASDIKNTKQTQTTTANPSPSFVWMLQLEPRAHDSFSQRGRDLNRVIEELWQKP